ncbi:MAG: radical SAM protein [Bdellovibrio sp.]
MEQLAKTLVLTTECSAGCSQCPFSNRNMIKRHLPVKKALQILAESSESLVVVSGGEPFEYVEIHSLLESLEYGVVPFRIATGGHVDLAPFIPKLKKLQALQGISLGTDVLTAKVNPDRRLPEVWQKNVYALQKVGIPISITVTVVDDAAEIQSIYEFIKRHGIRPQFFYIRSHPDFRSEVQDLLRTDYPNTFQIVDELIF